MSDTKKLDFRTIDYHTYKNRLIQNYPETIIDIQLVYNNDTFDFRKDSGKVIYTHQINDPFNPKKEIVGGYCVIKNKLGEFIEIMNKTEIEKCKRVAKMKNIWDTWESEMYLKTIIKRACKRFFYDVVKDIEEEDNKNYDLSLLEEKKKTPFSCFCDLIKDNLDKDKLIEEWNLTNDDIDAQRALYKRIEKTGK